MSYISCDTNAIEKTEKGRGREKERERERERERDKRPPRVLLLVRSLLSIELRGLRLEVLMLFGRKKEERERKIMLLLDDDCDDAS